MQTKRKKKQERPPLSRERVLEVAIKLADADGVEQLTMRRLAEELGIEAMSLYHHFPNKDAILDGMIDVVFAEIQPASQTLEWKMAMRRRADSVRAVLLRHRWAINLMESRKTPGPATLEHHDAVLGCLRRAGLSVPLTAHAYAVLDAYIYGFIHSELNLPFQTSDETQEVAREIYSQMPPGAYPHFEELVTAHVLKPGYAYGDEFGYGLDLILDALERALKLERKQSGSR
jgi:AcrR family transcriptional regulator